MKYSEWEVEEARIINYQTEPLAGPEEVENFNEWSHYNWDGKTPLHKLSKKDTPCIIEVKFKNIPTVFKFKWWPALLTDKGSIPSWIPRAVANDEGWLWQLIGYYIHDGGYAGMWGNRAMWDGILLAFLQVQHLSWWDRNKIWFSVRAGGWLKWKKPAWVYESVRRYGFHWSESDKFTIHPFSENAKIWKNSSCPLKTA